MAAGLRGIDDEDVDDGAVVGAAVASDAAGGDGVLHRGPARGERARVDLRNEVRAVVEAANAVGPLAGNLDHRRQVALLEDKRERAGRVGLDAPGPGPGGPGGLDEAVE